MAEIKVLALDLDGTLTNSQKEVTPRTRAALDAAIAKGVTIVLASGRPTAGVLPLAKELGLDKKGGCILSYNGGKIIDCRTGETLYQKQLDAQYVPELCAFAAAQNVTIITYNEEGVVTEHPDDKWALRSSPSFLPVRSLRNPKSPMSCLWKEKERMSPSSLASCSSRRFLNSRSFLNRCFWAISRFSASVLTMPPSALNSFILPSKRAYFRNSHSKLPLKTGILMDGLRPICSKHSSR